MSTSEGCKEEAVSQDEGAANDACMHPPTHPSHSTSYQVTPLIHFTHLEFPLVTQVLQGAGGTRGGTQRHRRSILHHHPAAGGRQQRKTLEERICALQQGRCVGVDYWG